MKVWLKAGVIIFYVLGYCFLRKRMRRDIVKLFKAYIIEFSQLIFMRGLFEWDDMIHNGLGCMIGCLFANIFRKKKNRD